MKKTTKRDFTALLTVYGLTKDVTPNKLAKWLETTAKSIRKDPLSYAQSIIKFKLMK